jgi:hypothetical protein
LASRRTTGSRRPRGREHLGRLPGNRMASRPLSPCSQAHEAFDTRLKDRPVRFTGIDLNHPPQIPQPQPASTHCPENAAQQSALDGGLQLHLSEEEPDRCVSSLSGWTSCSSVAVGGHDMTASRGEAAACDRESRRRSVRAPCLGVSPIKVGSARGGERWAVRDRGLSVCGDGRLAPGPHNEAVRGFRTRVVRHWWQDSPSSHISDK